MAFLTMTYSFSNSTTADATQVNTNFTDVINATSDGTKDMNINALTVAGAAAFNGNVTLGNASGDDITFTGSLASTIPIKTTATYNIGSSTLGLAGVYLGNSTFTTKLATAATASYTLTMPTGAGVADQALTTSGSGQLTWLNLVSGVYTPSLTNGSNVGASTAYQCIYTRVGSIVTVFGRLDIDPTAPGFLQTIVSISLPIASTFTSSEDLSGTSVGQDSGENQQAGFIQGATDKAQLVFLTNSSANFQHRFSFCYIIK